MNSLEHAHDSYKILLHGMAFRSSHGLGRERYIVQCTQRKVMGSATSCAYTNPLRSSCGSVLPILVVDADDTRCDTAKEAADHPGKPEGEGHVADSVVADEEKEEGYDGSDTHDYTCYH